MRHIPFVMFLLLIFCSTAAAAGDTANDPVAARRAEMTQRAQDAYDRIVAEQTEPLATTAEEVIERCIAAMGGREALASVQTLTLVSDGHQMAGGYGGTRYLKAPNFVRQESRGGRAVVTDGVSVWMNAADQWQPMPPGRLVWQQMMSISLDLIGYEEKNVAYEFAGTAALEGGAFYKLKKTISTGKEVFVYFNIATGFLTMEEEFRDDGRMANLFFDYRDVEGVTLPHLRIRIADVLDTPHVALLSYRLNEPLEEAWFEPK